MEKKNINIWVVRICTILLLTVFTIGRKYGQGGNAENLINSLQQQPCACCLNFNDVSEVAKVIDRAKNQLQQDKEELKEQKGYLEGQLEVTKRQAEVQKVQLREEIQKREDENKGLKNEINNLKSGNNENAGAIQVAKELDLKWSDYVKQLSDLNVCKEKLENNIRNIEAEKTNLENKLNEYKQNSQEKDKELEQFRKEIEDLIKIKEKIESDMKTKNESIKKYEEEKTRLIDEKTKLAKELEELKKEYKKKYESIVANNDEVVKKNTEAVGQNTEAINNINASLEILNNDNKKIIADIEKKTKEIENLNNQIKDNNSKIEKLNKEKDELNDKYDKLDIDHKELIQKYEEIDQKKEELEDSFKVCKGQMEYLTTQTNTLNDILKNIKTNVNMEEYANLYNSINAQKRANISIFLNKDVKTFPQKQYTFYIPFKFKDYGQCAIKKTISDVFTKNPGIYTTNLSLYDILRSFFEIKAFEKFKELKIIKVTNLKEIYFDVSFPYDGDKIKIEGKEKDVEVNRTKAIELPKIVTSPKTQSGATYNMRNKKNEVTKYDDIAKGEAYKTYMNKFFLDYSNLIELVGIDEYLNKKKIEDEKDKKKDKIEGKKDKKKDKIEGKKDKIKEKEDLFLLELDFKDPECIALLESVGKGNYGVVKKGLTFENGKLVTKAIKFTCSNSDFENSTEQNILKEIRAGKIVNEIGVGNKIAFVKDYMKIKEFKKRYNEERISLGEETENGDLTNAVYTTFLNDNLKTLPVGKEDVRKCLWI